MSACIIKKEEIKIKTIMTAMQILKEEVKDIIKTYWSTDANTQISSANDSDPVTLETHLIKTEYVGGITLCDELEGFFTNEVVTQGDYAQSCEKIKYGSAGTPTKLSDATEIIGDRMYQVTCDCITLFKQCRDILEFHSNNEINDMIANLDSQRVITCGNGLTKNELESGITLIEQFKKMLNNEAVTQGDYSATLAKWQRID